MSSKFVRSAIAVTVVVVTVIGFAKYFSDNPETLAALGQVSPLTVATLFFLYAVFIATLVMIQRATLDLCDLRLKPKENALVVMYSSVINFFGPLQSGPAFRAAYLKKKHNINLRKYTMATLMYYGLYALFSATFILSYFVGWAVVLGVLITFAAAPLALRLAWFRGLQLRAALQLALATFMQVGTLTLIYYVELHSLMPQVTYLQSLIYTGVANLALFVSLTPGAIGFRESFLLLSQQVHDISGGVIAAASVIDRGIYIVLLLIMAALIFGLHANDYLKLPKKRDP